jgi:hypothetical protein
MTPQQPVRPCRHQISFYLSLVFDSDWSLIREWLASRELRVQHTIGRALFVHGLVPNYKHGWQLVDREDRTVA